MLLPASVPTTKVQAERAMTEARAGRRATVAVRRAVGVMEW